MFWAFVEPDAIDGNALVIQGKKGHHLGRVLRVRTGERGVAITNGQRYEVEVLTVNGDRVATRVLAREAVDESPVSVTILQAVLPNADFDAVVEAVSAIGIRRLVAVQAARSVRHPGRDRLARWQAIAESAAEQSHAVSLPEIAGPVELDAALATLNGPLLVLDPRGGRPLVEAIEPRRPHALAIGPEGGWTADELERLAQAGGTTVNLGGRILRSRLAPIVATAILVHQS